MIKRIRFATRAAGVTPEAFTAAWPRAVGPVAGAPPEVRPSRVVVCTTLPELSGPDPRHDGVAFEWFTDAEHLGRFEAWLDTADGVATSAALSTLVDTEASPVLVAEEHALRGADWLEQRWRDGGMKLKHLALARRAPGLTAAEFSERWRGHAGRLGRSGGPDVVIPEEVRGLAYVQNHPCPRASGSWAYDAVNEVWFDDVEGLRRRIAWFRENPPAADGLVGESWFLAAREEVLFP